MIQTERLILRRWREEDRAPFVALHEDPEVAYWLGGPKLVAGMGEAIDRYNAQIDAHGFGKFALERREDGALLGAVGVSPVFQGLPIEGFEVGWRLTRSAWGEGYASEAARAAIADAFAHELDEIISFTTQANRRSQAVMGRIGMVRDPGRDWDHPALEEGDPLRRHLVWSLRG